MRHIRPNQMSEMQLLCIRRRRLFLYCRGASRKRAAPVQGVGNFVNTGVLLLLLCVFNVTSIADQQTHPKRLEGVWRTSFGLGLIPIVLILLYRIFVLRVPTPPIPAWGMLLLVALDWRASLPHNLCGYCLSRAGSPQ